ncbi:HAMP domain-containing histidine kinase [Oscillatoria sp. FACHB-1407]|nr:HAMP domain-containing histidine kinase [Oscillatoria sp. FACHB-1407]
MIVGIATLTIIGSISSPRFFVVYLEKIEFRGVVIRQVRKELVQGFKEAWTRGAFWSVAVGATTAGGLSYLVTKRIVQPLVQMEDITKQFGAGQMTARVPANEIPELDQLATSFNRMASSLADVEQRRRELVSDLTHELRTPLTVLNGYLEGLTDGTVEPSPQIYALLGQQTKRMQRLVNDLQELSKMEAGYLPIDTLQVDLHSLLSSVVRTFADQLTAESPVTLSLKYPNDIPPVLADPQRVEQILANLLSNALRYTSVGMITVEVTYKGDFVWIAVTDTGIGIATEDLPHVFERFWRADRSRDRHSGGTGIGLAICRRLVELQGGTIEVESQLDQGSTFRFSLPIA